MRNTGLQFMTELKTKHSPQWAVLDLRTLPVLQSSAARWHWLRAPHTGAYSTGTPPDPATGAPHGGRHCSCQV